MYSLYNAGFGMGKTPWDARASIVGQGVQMTFSPCYNTPDTMIYASSQEDDGVVQVGEDDLAGGSGAAEAVGDSEAAYNPIRKKSKKTAKTKSSFSFPLGGEELQKGKL